MTEHRAPHDAEPDAPPDAIGGRGLRLITVVLAVACGLAVANLYYAQPLLAAIARSFGISQGRAAIVVTVTQFGYALGMLVLLPLGDLLENRRLTAATLIGTAMALGVCATAPDFGLFLAASALVGLTSVVAQILIPLAANLAPADQRGAFVGRVMSGLLLGILLARTVSSLVASVWGWRTVFAISAGLMVVMSGVLFRSLPRRRPGHTDGYRSLMASVITLAVEEPVLRRRAIAQALMFGAFSAFWTSIAYELASRHGLSQVGIGIFALVGAGGAASAPLAGWLGDRGLGRPSRGAVPLIAVAAMILAATCAGNLVLLALAGVLLDLASQGGQVLNQRDIYALRADARARINTVYMTTVFLGGAFASAVSGVLYEAHGWPAVALFGAALPAIAFAQWALESGRGRGYSATSTVEN